VRAQSSFDAWEPPFAIAFAIALSFVMKRFEAARFVSAFLQRSCRFAKRAGQADFAFYSTDLHRRSEARVCERGVRLRPNATRLC
jgi:hypothetical protein